MQALKVTLSENQYQQLARTAETANAPIADIITQAINCYLHDEARQRRYARLADKLAQWQSTKPSLEKLHIDFIYHSEALEGSPLSKQQVEETLTSASL